MAEPQALTEELFRHQYGRLVAGLTRVFGPGKLDLVEDVVQEAMLRATKVWPFEGRPEHPAAWLMRVARNLAVDAVRHEKMAAEKHAKLIAWARAERDAHSAGDAPIRDALVDRHDDSLALIFMCCHPSLAPEVRVALTLKTLCGFGVGEIAAALLEKEATVAQRLSRAKARLQRDAVRFELPGPADLDERLGSVLEVVYLVFNEGYRAHRGDDLVRDDLVLEALRLTHLLTEEPRTDRPEVHALLALMLFQGARLPARVGDLGEALTLAQQDRRQWKTTWIRLGGEQFRQSLQGERLTAWHVEAAIAACHASAPTYANTDWSTILDRYDQLLVLRPESPIVRLNRAVAVAKVHGPLAGLAQLDAIQDHPKLQGYALLPATRAQLLWAAGDHTAAATALERALAHTTTAPERRLLGQRLAAIRAGEVAPQI